MSQGTFRNKLTWFDKLSLVQFYGAASYLRACIHFLHCVRALSADVQGNGDGGGEDQKQ